MVTFHSKTNHSSGKSQTEMTVKVSERNLDPMLGQAQKCDRVKLIIRIITVTPLYI